MTSYLFNGQWTTDKNERKYRHMYIVHNCISCLCICRNTFWRKTTNTIRLLFYNKLRHMHKQEMELCTCVCTSCYICQLFTDHWRGRTSFLSSETIILFYFILWISHLCLKMSSFLHLCTCVMPRTFLCAHAQCRVNFIHHVEFYFRFRHLITFPVYSQLWRSSQGE